MGKFEKLLDKKKKDGDKMNENEKKAKMSVLENLRDQASDAMASKLHGMKQVSVAAKDQEGLEKGLDKAHELVKHMPEMEEKMSDFAAEESGEAPAEEAAESVEDERAESEHMSEADIDAKLEELMKMKEALKSKKA